MAPLASAPELHETVCGVEVSPPDRGPLKSTTGHVATSCLVWAQGLERDLARSKKTTWSIHEVSMEMTGVSSNIQQDYLCQKTVTDVVEEVSASGSSRFGG